MTSTPTSPNYSNKSKKSNVEAEQIPEPDSTTTLEKEVNEFSAGQEVLVKRIDDKEKIEKFFFGTVVEVNVLQHKCLVKYGDNTNHWAAFKDLTKLSTPEEEDLLCVVCKKSAPKSKREIISCDKCGRGYHKKCHQPEIPFVCQKNESNWMCSRCLHNEPKKLRMRDTQSRRNSLSSLPAVENESADPMRVRTLPYDLNLLSWDTNHRVNIEQIYCYCGGNGEWNKHMLQCGRCRQWFHEECIDCLRYPIYCGDRFYVFVCSICNHGKEFVRRLEMKWDDLVHLMLYNLTVYHSKKYYDLDNVILPYINDNWHALQLPATIFVVTKDERRGHILSVLRNNRTRFKCGREIKKKTTIWGLRVRLPPPAPYLTLPQTGRIQENDLRILWQGDSRLQVLPNHTGYSRNTVSRCKRVVSSDPIMMNLMMGMTYKRNGALSESESPCPSPEAEEDNASDNTIKLDNYIGKGCVKKSVPFPKMSTQIRKRLLAITSPKDKFLRRAKRRQTISEIDDSKEEKGRGAYLTRLSLDNKKNSNNKCNESLPPTPPTSVSAPPTPPASGSTSTVSDLSNDCLESAKEVKVVKSCPDTGSLTELNTQCDTSGDETSSKSTLDLIIPPPKDFEGKNNPFLALLRGNNDRKRKRRSKDSITLPLPLTAVIPGKPNARPMKRQLSEKDIIIGPNGEVKRKRLRRNRTSYVAGQTASKTATVVPIKPDNKDWNAACSSNTPSNDNFFGGRRLRQRPEKPVEKEKTPNPPTPKPSPVKTEPDISMDELKSSVNIYFGAANRIAAGERFTIKAKRYGPTGKLEYLIEWDGPSSNGLT
ncbi:PHD finger protein 19 isoform X2 [Coccinella septempunctata]|nr:PHD finger protein 19 isoform X2 [Coccinella septempunctata]